MKLITLNLWGGTVFEPLMDFIQSHSKDVDVFSFQEMLYGNEPDFTPIDKGRINLFSEIVSRLPEFVPYKYVSASDYFQHEPISFGAGQTIFVRKSIIVKDTGGFYCFKETPVLAMEGGKLTGNFQWIELEVAGMSIFIGNLHGVWLEGSGKVDSPERFEQSQKIKDFMNSKTGKKIICGDFNLNPDGKSIEMLEVGMKNLVKEYGITSTRSKFYPKESKFADYILISPDIQVKDFQVLQDAVSDHLPLTLEFN